MKLKKPIAALLVIFLILFSLTFLFFQLSGHLPFIPLKAPSSVNPTKDNPKHIHLTYQHDPASTITVIWQTNTPNVGDIVLYDTVPRGGNYSLYRNSTTGSHHNYASASGYIHQVELTNLTHSTIYYFICGGPGNYSAERSFKTAPNSFVEFKFVAGGDSRSDPASRTQVSQAMSRVDPSFVMHSGDMVYDGKIQSVWDTWFTDVNDNWIGDNNLTIPVIPCLGNHENNATNYYEQFALPENEQWYYVDWGPNLRIIVLNSEARDQISTDQADWLNSTLFSTPENTWKIVMFHRNVYFSGKHENDTDIIDNWVPLFDKYHVDIVIQGHTHHYHRTKPMYNNSIVSSYQNGTMYLTSGGWGAPTHDYINQSYSTYGNETHHFVVISVFQNELYIEAKDINGYTFDDAWINKTAQSSKSANGITFETSDGNTSLNPLPVDDYLVSPIESTLGAILLQKSYMETNFDFSNTVTFRTYSSTSCVEKVTEIGLESPKTILGI
jgi:predicted phosphodiesterase